MQTHYINNQNQLFCWLLTIFWSLNQGGAVSYAAESIPLTETQVKVVFLFNFAKFITWPDKTFTNAEESFQICVLGNDSFGETLDLTIQNEKIKQRPILLQRLQKLPTNNTVRSCLLVVPNKLAWQLFWPTLNNDPF